MVCYIHWGVDVFDVRPIDDCLHTLLQNDWFGVGIINVSIRNEWPVPARVADRSTQRVSGIAIVIHINYMKQILVTLVEIKHILFQIHSNVLIGQKNTF